MHLKNEQPDLVTDKAFPEDAAIEELDALEENEEVYKWLSFLLVIIWAVSLVLF